jgi:hypothetical protein
MDASTKSSLEGNIPIGRLGRVEECVDVVSTPRCWCCSDSLLTPAFADLAAAHQR